jgi:hypothetical protein
VCVHALIALHLRARLCRGPLRLIFFNFFFYLNTAGRGRGVRGGGALRQHARTRKKKKIESRLMQGRKLAVGLQCCLRLLLQHSLCQ